MNARTATIAAHAREAGYQVEEIEQVRPNRWVLVLHDPGGMQILALVQQRPLVSAADVLDLAEMLSLRHLGQGLLVALDGKFSEAARQTAAELNAGIMLDTAFPTAPPPQRTAPVLKSV